MVPSSAGEAVQKLIDAFTLIQYREDVKPHEATRIQDAFSSMTESFQEGSSHTIKRRNTYRWFLKKVQDAAGPQMVVLCAVGLGQSAIAGMRDRILQEFLAGIKEKEKVLTSTILKKLADEYFKSAAPNEKANAAIEQEQAIGSLTGRVYELAFGDLHNIAMSNQIDGPILLTDPYEQDSSPFVTFKISEDLKSEFATQRVQIM